jgi:glycosyltransferase involved in cell wall biosynthesis
MIVKNEGKIIKRCLDSVKRIIDYVCIVDTGSTDNTIKEIHSWLKDNSIEGGVLKKDWVNFAVNRTQALAAIRENKDIDYVFMIDADETLEYEKDFDAEKFKSELKLDLYHVNCKLGGIEYHRTTLTKNSMPYIYKGVVHEYLECLETISTRGLAKGITNIPIQDSHRNEDKIKKFLDDAQKLEEAMKTETDPVIRTRYTFYLGQCYSDAKEYKKALPYYLERTKMGGWKEEIAVAYYKAGNIMAELKYPDEEVIQTYLNGFEAYPLKLECLHGAAKYCRLKKRFQQAFMISGMGLKLKKPEVGLFHMPWIWEYGIEDEFSTVAYWAGYYKEGLEVVRKLINKVPESERARILENLNFYLDKLDVIAKS